MTSCKGLGLSNILFDAYTQQLLVTETNNRVNETSLKVLLGESSFMYLHIQLTQNTKKYTLMDKSLVQATKTTISGSVIFNDTGICKPHTST